TAVGNTDGKIIADGSAVGGDGVPAANVGVGVAVAVNHVSAHTTARLGVANHTVGGLTVEALSLDIAAYREDDNSTARRTNTFLASAASGAGGTNVGIAGSLGLNLVDTEASATIGTGTSVALTSGGVLLAADNRTSITAKALPAGVDEDG